MTTAHEPERETTRPRWHTRPLNPTSLLPDRPPACAPESVVRASAHAVEMWDAQREALLNLRVCKTDIDRARGLDRASDASAVAAGLPLADQRLEPAARLAHEAAQRRHEAAVLAWESAATAFLDRAWITSTSGRPRRLRRSRSSSGAAESCSPSLPSSSMGWSPSAAR